MKSNIYCRGSYLIPVDTSILFFCGIRLSSSIEYDWYKENGSKIIPTKRIYYENRGETLNILDLKFKDGQLYTCVLKIRGILLKFSHLLTVFTIPAKRVFATVLEPISGYEEYTDCRSLNETAEKAIKEDFLKRICNGKCKKHGITAIIKCCSESKMMVDFSDRSREKTLSWENSTNYEHISYMFTIQEEKFHWEKKKKQKWTNFKLGSYAFSLIISPLETDQAKSVCSKQSFSYEPEFKNFYTKYVKQVYYAKEEEIKQFEDFIRESGDEGNYWFAKAYCLIDLYYINRVQKFKEIINSNLTDVIFQEHSNKDVLNNFYCNAGSEFDPYVLICVPCKPGYYKSVKDLEKMSCSKCTPGSFSNEYGSKECKSCPGQRFSIEGAASIFECKIDKNQPIKFPKWHRKNSDFLNLSNYQRYINDEFLDINEIFEEMDNFDRNFKTKNTKTKTARTLKAYSFKIRKYKFSFSSLKMHIKDMYKITLCILVIVAIFQIFFCCVGCCKT